MKKLILVLSSSLMLLTIAACDTSRTSSDAPRNITGEVEDPQSIEETKEDADDNIRQAQLNADIRAREQRNEWMGNELERADADLQSEVRAKLEANIPGGKLTVEAEEGVVTIVGTVPDQQEYETIEPLAQEIKGVKGVEVDVQVVPPNPS